MLSLSELHGVFKLSEESKVAFVIPAYNEARSLPKLLKNINEEILTTHDNVDILVFEDGSTDSTKDVLMEIFNSGDIPQFYPFMTPDRKGYPKAVKDAIDSLDPTEYSYVLFMDGDGQYPLDDIKKVLEYNISGKFDIVVGGRVKRVEPIWRKILTLGIRVIESILFNPAVKDVTSALRLIKIETAQKISSDIKYSKYNYWLEFTARMSAMDINVIELPVGYIERYDGESQVYAIKSLPKILWAEIKAVLMTFLELQSKTVLKFVLVGFTGAIIILFFSWFFTEYLGTWYILSTAIGIEISIIWAFILNTKLTFKFKFQNNSNTIKSLIQYHFTALGGMVINLIALYLLTEYGQLYYLLSEVLGILFSFSFNYLASSKYVWNKHSKKSKTIKEVP